jgi:ubiquitin C-terminal hydrolase
MSCALPAFGLPNLGNTCYFNSILQGLISCPKFNQTILENKDLLKSRTAVAMYNFVHAAINGSVPDTRMVKDALVADLKNTSDPMQLRFAQHSAQECAYESYTFLIDKINCPPVSSLFTCRITNTITCTSCKHQIVHRELVTHCRLNPTLPTVKPSFIVRLLTNQEKLADYKCDKCGKCTCISNAKYTMVPEIIVIITPKYLDGIVDDLPLEIKIPNLDNKPMVYKVVANVEHAGNRFGGHYWCRAEREDGLYELNDSSVTKVASIKNTSATFISFYTLC